MTFNGRDIFIPTVFSALKLLTDCRLKIAIDSQLPLGCGFGISGASTLATLFAANKILKIGAGKNNLSAIAHFAEIKEKTGLGTVVTQTTGGFLLKTKPGIPGKIINYPFIGNKIFAIILGELKTSRILKDGRKLERISKAADSTMQKIKKINNPTFGQIFDYSYEFLLKSEIFRFTDAFSIIEKIKSEGGHATLAILGEVVLSTIKPNDFCDNIVELTVTPGKAK